MKGVCRAAFAAIATFAAGAAIAQELRFSEMLINPPSTDQGKEFIELISADPGFDMSLYTIVVIDGDGTSAGVIDQALPLSGWATGTNRLFMWRDDAQGLEPPPEVATVIRSQDFTPDIENGTNTYVLVKGFSGAVGNDLDTNNDGVLETTPWTSAHDAIGWQDNLTGFAYAVALGGTNYSPSGWGPDAYTLLSNGTGVVMDVIVGANPLGPFLAVFDRNSGNLSGEFMLTPGGFYQYNAIPTAYQLVFGNHIGGGTAELTASDNMYLEVSESPPFTPTGASVIVRVESALSIPSPTQMTLRIETATSAAPPNSLTQVIQMRNYVTSTWEVVDTRGSTAGDNTIDITVTGDPSRFVETGTRKVEMRFNYFDPGTLFVATWAVKIDFVRWTVR
jgi:hypothetical protein